MLKVLITSAAIVAIGLLFGASSEILSSGKAVSPDIVSPVSSAMSLDTPTTIEDSLARGADAQTCDVESEMVAAGGSCGGNTCGKGTYCCNASCGLCVPFGMRCTQQSCN